MRAGLRAFDLSRDDVALAALLTANSEEPETVADVHAWFGNEVTGSVWYGVMATDGLAYADVYRQPWHDPQQFACRVLVAEADRRHGIGRRLLAEISDFARAHGAKTLRGPVRENSPAGRAFADLHGATVVRHFYESTLDPRTVDQALLAKPVPPGVVIVSFAELGDTEEHRLAHWRLNERLGQDQPGDIGRRERSFEAYTRQVFHGSWFSAAGQFIAIADGAWVGIGAVGYFEETNSLYHMFTGVDSAYRGRGIASALKRATIAYALEIGADYLETGNDSTNAPMLAVNAAYGYVRRPGFWDMRYPL